MFECGMQNNLSLKQNQVYIYATKELIIQLNICNKIKVYMLLYVYY